MFINVKYRIPPPFKCCVKNRILPLKWYIPLKKKTKHLIMYFYVVLSRFGFF